MSRDSEGQASGAGLPVEDDAALMREMRLQRNLKIVVIGLGVLILAGLAAVVIRIMQLAARGPQTPAASVAVPAATPGARQIGLALPPGARIVSVSVSANRLAVHHESPSGTGITVLDTETGAPILQIAPQTVAPAAP